MLTNDLEIGLKVAVRSEIKGCPLVTGGSHLNPEDIADCVLQEAVRALVLLGKISEANGLNEPVELQCSTTSLKGG